MLNYDVPLSLRKRHSGGFTLIELMIVIAIDESAIDAVLGQVQPELIPTANGVDTISWCCSYGACGTKVFTIYMQRLLRVNAVRQV